MKFLSFFVVWVGCLGMYSCSPELPKPTCIALSTNLNDAHSLPFQHALAKQPNATQIWSRSEPGLTELCYCLSTPTTHDSLWHKVQYVWQQVSDLLPPHAQLIRKEGQNPVLTRIFDLDLRKIKPILGQSEILSFAQQLETLPGVQLRGLPQGKTAWVIVPNVSQLQRYDIPPSQLLTQLKEKLSPKTDLSKGDLAQIAIDLPPVDSGKTIPLSEVAAITLQEVALPDFISILWAEDEVDMTEKALRNSVEQAMVKFLVAYNLTDKPGMSALRSWDSRRPVRYEFSGTDELALCTFIETIIAKEGFRIDKDEAIESPTCREMHYEVVWDPNRLAQTQVKMDDILPELEAIRPQTLRSPDNHGNKIVWNPLAGGQESENLSQWAIASPQPNEWICVKDLAKIQMVPAIRRENLRKSIPIYVWGPQGTAIINGVETFPLPAGIERSVGDNRYQYPDFRNPEDFH